MSLLRLEELAMRVGRGMAILLCALVVAAIPGSGLRPAPIELAAPLLPPAADRDASLDVGVRSALTQGPVEGARIQVLTLVDGRAYLAGTRRTESSGRASIEGLPHGEVWLLADAPGFSRASSQLVLMSGPRAIESRALLLAPAHRRGRRRGRSADIRCQRRGRRGRSSPGRRPHRSGRKGDRRSTRRATLDRDGARGELRGSITSRRS